MAQVWKAYLACEALGSVTRDLRVQDCATKKRCGYDWGENHGPGDCVRFSPRSCSSLRMLACSISFACVSLNSASVVCNCAFVTEPM